MMAQLTLKKAITYFLDAKGSVRAEKTVTSYSQVLIPFSEFAKGEWPVSPDTINAYLAAANKRGCKPNTIWDYYRTLKIFFHWLQQRGLVEQNPVLLAERPTKERLIPRAPKELTLQKLFDRLYLIVDNGRGHWMDTRDLAMFILALDTGARVGELAGVTVRQVDISQQTISIICSKTNTARTIVFSDKAARWLQPWLEVRAGLDLPKELDSLFVGQPLGGVIGRLTTSGMQYVLKIWQKRAGIDHFNFHRLRHSYAVYTLRAGGELTDIQRQMGHSNISTTAIYLRVDDAGRQGRHNLANPLGYLLSQGGAL